MARRINSNPNAIIPAGSKVVLRAPLVTSDGTTAQMAGAVGVITRPPPAHEQEYHVRFLDGSEASLWRSQFMLLKHLQANATGSAVDANKNAALYDFVIYLCIIGSQAYGLADDESDIDRRGIYLPPAVMQWSLYGIPEQLVRPETEETYWELRKFLLLALKANPNVLECLYTPLVEYAAPLAEELRAMRGKFLSKLLYQTYNGYVLSQFKKIETGLSHHGMIKWKHAMHLVRLLLSGITALREGQVRLGVGEYREQLVAIRDGVMPWNEINAWRLALHRELDAAYAATKLPDQPDYEQANALLIKARQTRALGSGLERKPQVDDSGARSGCGKLDGIREQRKIQPMGDPVSMAGLSAEVSASVIAEQPLPLLFVTISGAHLYGFPSADSDYDFRGVHILPVREVIGLDSGQETIEVSGVRDGREVDFVTHDARKFFLLLLKHNGYVLEQLYSPLIVHTTTEHAELKEVARGCITRHHAHHYLGFARTQWHLFEKDRRVKPLLYVYRVLLTGIHLMRTGAIEANLVRLNKQFRLAFIDELIAQKVGGKEKDLLRESDFDFHARECARLTAELEAAHNISSLPEEPTAWKPLNDLLLRLRKIENCQ